MGVEQPFAIEASVVPDSGRRQAYALKLNASKNTTMVPTSKDRERWEHTRMESVYSSSILNVKGIPNTQSLGQRTRIRPLSLRGEWA